MYSSIDGGEVWARDAALEGSRGRFKCSCWVSSAMETTDARKSSTAAFDLLKCCLFKGLPNLFAPSKGGIEVPDVPNCAVPSRKALVMPSGNASDGHPWKARNTASRNKVQAFSPITSLPKNREEDKKKKLKNP